MFNDRLLRTLGTYGAIYRDYGGPFYGRSGRSKEPFPKEGPLLSAVNQTLNPKP